MVVQEWFPRQGDFVWVTFSPQIGHEQAGRRPALVLSPESYNRRSGLMLACPVTTRIKGYLTEVPVSECGLNGIVLADQLRSLDWRLRNVVWIGTATDQLLAQVMRVLNLLLPK
jgi:mRNA interferase MazF